MFAMSFSLFIFSNALSVIRPGGAPYRPQVQQFAGVQEKLLKHLTRPYGPLLLWNRILTLKKKLIKTWESSNHFLRQIDPQYI